MDTDKYVHISFSFLPLNFGSGLPVLNRLFLFLLSFGLSFSNRDANF